MTVLVKGPRDNTDHTQSTRTNCEGGLVDTRRMVVVLVPETAFAPFRGISRLATTAGKLLDTTSSTVGYPSGSHFAARVCSRPRMAMDWAAVEQLDHSVCRPNRTNP